MHSPALALLCLACAGSLTVSASPSLCGKISPGRVSDIQWSGSPSATTENVYYSGPPYNPDTGEHVSVAAGDYFTLSAASGTNYQLKQYSGDDALKSTFPEGAVKADADAVFVIIDGWFGTVITKEDHSSHDSDTFTDLQTNPSSTLLQGACLVSAPTPAPEPAPTPAPAAPESLCGKISPGRVSDIQWSGSPSATTENVYYSGTPFNPDTGGHVSVAAGDYFTLSAASGTNYQLKQYSGDGALKSTFPEGAVKADAEAVFVIIDGWFGTVITKEDHSSHGSDTFTGLQTDPSSTYLEETCVASQELSATPPYIYLACFSTALVASLVSACAMGAFSFRKAGQSDSKQPLLVV